MRKKKSVGSFQWVFKVYLWCFYGFPDSLCFPGGLFCLRKKGLPELLPWPTGPGRGSGCKKCWKGFMLHMSTNIKSILAQFSVCIFNIVSMMHG